MKWIAALVAAAILGGAIFLMSRPALHQTPTSEGFDAFLKRVRAVADRDAAGIAACFHPSNPNAKAANIFFMAVDVRKTESLKHPVLATARFTMTIDPAPEGSGPDGYVPFTCTFDHDGSTWGIGTKMEPFSVTVSWDTQDRLWSWLLDACHKAQ